MAACPVLSCAAEMSCSTDVFTFTSITFTTAVLTVAAVRITIIAVLTITIDALFIQPLLVLVVLHDEDVTPTPLGDVCVSAFKDSCVAELLLLTSSLSLLSSMVMVSDPCSTGLCGAHELPEFSLLHLHDLYHQTVLGRPSCLPVAELPVCLFA